MKTHCRRIVIELWIHGSEEQAQCVERAVGTSLGSGILSQVIRPLVASEQIEEVRLIVKGEPMVSAKF